MEIFYDPCLATQIYDNRGKLSRTDTTLNFTADGTPFTAKYFAATKLIALYHDGNYVAGSFLTKPFDVELFKQIIESWFKGDNALAATAGWIHGVKKLRY